MLLPEPDIDAIAKLLDQLGRRAYVAGDGMVTVVLHDLPATKIHAEGP